MNYPLDIVKLCNDINMLSCKNDGSQYWLVVFRLNVPVNNFSVMSGRSHRFLGK